MYQRPQPRKMMGLWKKYLHNREGRGEPLLPLLLVSPMSYFLRISVLGLLRKIKSIKVDITNNIKRIENHLSNENDDNTQKGYNEALTHLKNIREYSAQGFA